MSTQSSSTPKPKSKQPRHLRIVKSNELSFDRLKAQLSSALVAIQAADNVTRLERSQASADALRRFLRAVGRCFKTSAGGVYVEGRTGKAIYADSADCRLFLSALTGIPDDNSSLIKNAHNALRTVCTLDGEEGEAVMLSALRGKRIFVRALETELIEIGGGGMKRHIPNGTEGVIVGLSAGEGSIAPIPPRLPRADYALKALRRVVESFAFEILTVDEALALLLVFMASIFLPRELIGDRPALLVLGEYQTGKSTFARLIGRMLFGPKFNLIPSPDKNAQRDVETILARSAMAAFDDLEQADPGFRAIVKSAVTGMEIARRELFTTATLTRLPVDVTLAFTAKINPFAGADDLASRLIIIGLAPRTSKTFIPNHIMFRRADAARPMMLSIVLDLIQRSLGDLLRGGLSTERLAGFEVIGRTLARHGGFEKDFAQALKKIAATRAQNVLEDDHLAEDIRTLLKKSGNDHFEGSAAELLRQLRGDGRATGIDFEMYRNYSSQRLGRELGDKQAAFRDIGIEVRKLPRSGKSRGWSIKLL